MASSINAFFFTPAVSNSFQPLLSEEQMKSVISANRKHEIMRVHTAYSNSLLEHIYDLVKGENIMSALMDEVKQPYKDCVSVLLFRVSHYAFMRVDGYDNKIRIGALLHSNKHVLNTLNQGLGPNFRVVRRTHALSSNEVELHLEFWPNGWPVVGDPPGAPVKCERPVMNPEDEEFVEMPMVARRMSFDSE